MEFSIGGVDVSMFFPVRVSFVGQGSIAGIRIASVSRVDTGDDVVFSEDASVVTQSYTVI